MQGLRSVVCMSHSSNNVCALRFVVTPLEVDKRACGTEILERNARSDHAHRGTALVAGGAVMLMSGNAHV